MTDSIPKKVDVLVLGTEIQQLALALECASVGLKVAVQMPSAATELSAPLVSSVFDPDGVVAELINQVAAPLQDTEAQSVFVHKTFFETTYLMVQGEWHETETVSVFGIPSSPLASKTGTILGAAGSARAYLDRLKPVLTIGKMQNLGRLVTSRIGKKALRLLVEPQLQFFYGRDAFKLDTPAVIPGLNETLTRTGSLTGAVLAYYERYKKAVTQVAPDCDWDEFKRLMLEKIILMGGQVIPTQNSETSLEVKDLKVEARAIVKLADRNAAKRNILRVPVEMQNTEAENTEAENTGKLKNNSMGFISWENEAGETFAAALTRQAELVTQTEQQILEIRSPVVQVLTEDAVTKAFELSKTKPKTNLTIKDLINESYFVDAEPATEAELHEIAANSTKKIAEIGTTEPTEITLLIDTSQSGLARSIKEALEIGIHLRRHLLGISVT